jgi:hypothetical protein
MHGEILEEIHGEEGIRGMGEVIRGMGEVIRGTATTI